MYVVVVNMQVKPDKVEAFKDFIYLDHAGTRQEPGNLRFDVIQGVEDPTRFMLYEVYKTPADMDAHRQTPHLAHYLAHIEEYLVEPRTATRFMSVFPADDG